MGRKEYVHKMEINKQATSPITSLSCQIKLGVALVFVKHVIVGIHPDSDFNACKNFPCNIIIYKQWSQSIWGHHESKANLNACKHLPLTQGGLRCWSALDCLDSIIGIP